jgi:UDP-N-acetylglucosamine:LPS N-acetylglucosamine transferase
MPKRVLILTASIGEGHDLPARTLSDQIKGEYPDTDVVVADGLRAMGRQFILINESAAGVVFYRFRWLWDAAFWFFVTFVPSRRFLQWYAWKTGGRGLLRLIAETEPDVIVSVYPVTTEVLGHLRRTGQINVPVCAAITDLAMMHYWAAPGLDLHLITHPETEVEVRSIAGQETEVRVVHGLTRPEFIAPYDSAEARHRLGLPATGKVVLVSGGGWGVGNLSEAVEAALALETVSAVVCLCGRNEELRARLTEQFESDPRFRAEGFTEEIADWLAAGDALIHSTGGLTVLEAHMRGCPTISFGWGRGHIRANNAAFREFGLAEVASSQAELRAALDRALVARGTPNGTFAALPSAASAVLGLTAHS